MAIYCDVCGQGLMNSHENEGGFFVDFDFKSLAPEGGNQIRNSCIDCGKRIERELNEATKGIVEKIVKDIRNHLYASKSF